MASTIALYLIALALAGVAFVVFRYHLGSSEPRQSPQNHFATTDELVSLQAAVQTLSHDLSAVTTELETLTLAVADGISRTDRAEKRIQKTVASARKQLAKHGLEHAGLEAESGELFESDGDGGEEEGLPALPAPLELHRPTGIPGVSRADLERYKENLG